MNWKDYPNLFFNGKFRFMHEKKLLPNNSFTSINLHDEGKTPIDIEITAHSKEKHRWVEFNNCKLIARHVSDMSDDEFNEHQQHVWTIDNPKNGLRIGQYESPESFLYLLRISVLPPNFDTTDVIFKEKS